MADGCGLVIWWCGVVQGLESRIRADSREREQGDRTSSGGQMWVGHTADTQSRVGKHWTLDGRYRDGIRGHTFFEKYFICAIAAAWYVLYSICIV